MTVLKQSYANTCLWTALSQWLLDFYPLAEDRYQCAQKIFQAITENTDPSNLQSSLGLMLKRLLVKAQENLIGLEENLNALFYDETNLARWNKAWGETMELLFTLAPLSKGGILLDSEFLFLEKKSNFSSLKALWRKFYKDNLGHNATSDETDAPAKTAIKLLQKTTGVEFIFLKFNKGAIETLSEDKSKSLCHFLETAGSIIIAQQHALYCKKKADQIHTYDPENGKLHTEPISHWLKKKSKIDTTWIIPQTIQSFKKEPITNCSILGQV